MKLRITIFLAGILLFSASLKADWQPQTSGTTENLNSVYFTTELTGCAVGANGEIIITVNGGTAWTSPASGTTQGLLAVDFPSPLTGYAAGGNGTIVKTTNGGLTWTAGTVPNMLTINDVDFINDNTGFVCGADGRSARTTNGGTSWISGTNLTIDLTSLRAFDAATVIVAGISGSVYKTTNSGQNWTQQPTPSNNFISSIVFSDLTNGYFTTLGLTEQFYRTTNGGGNWIETTSPGSTSGLADLSIVNSLTVYGCGSNAAIRRTTNGGQSWQTQPVTGGVTSYLNDIFMVNANVGYAVGANGTVLRTSNGGVGIQQISSEIPERFSLSQNYPNPFNPVTNFEFSISPVGAIHESPVKLSVYNTIGEEIAVLINEPLKAGVYKYSFDASALNSGVYFYRMSAGDFSETRRMILVK